MATRIRHDWLAVSPTLPDLETSLKLLYQHPEQPVSRLPVDAPILEIEDLGSCLASIPAELLGDAFVVSDGRIYSQIGSGFFPVEVVPSLGLF